jgi:hypothetical protein
MIVENSETTKCAVGGEATIYKRDENWIILSLFILKKPAALLG